MLLAEAGCVFMVFILYVSGVQRSTNSICALKGSSADLPCAAEHPTSSMKWYIEYRQGSIPVRKELHADENHITYSMSKERKFTLTIKDLAESDAKFYCCRESTGETEKSREGTIQLHVTDLQVKVIPTTEGQTVSLMCSTSCPLTENPAAYIWYKNGEFLYEDWSPWYQELVSSEEAVRYSCAVKGYEDLRAPDVSVESVTSTCFNVTYTKGRMCSYKQTSEDEPCTITFPKEIHVQKTPAAASGHFKMTCNTSCPLTDKTIDIMSSDKKRQKSNKPEFVVPITAPDSFSCFVKGLKDLQSSEVCVDDKNCWSVNYMTRRICALEGSLVNISSEYLYPQNQQPKSKYWYKIKRNGKEDTGVLREAADQVEHQDNMKNHHILTIKNLKKKDSAEYIFRLRKDDDEWKQSEYPGVTLVVTGLTVKFTPSSVVTEGQRVTLTCSTSCPLTDNTNYIWYLNSRPLTQPENQHKHLVLDPVSSQHAGSYSCAVKSHKDIRSRKEALTVQRLTRKWIPAASAGVSAVLIIILLAVFWWMRRKRESRQSSRNETSSNLEQLSPGPVYDEISDEPTEQDDLHYSKVFFNRNHTVCLYSSVQQHQLQDQEHIYTEL